MCVRCHGGVPWHLPINILLELYIVPQNYISNKVVLSKILISVNLGLSLSALSRFFIRAVSPYSFALKLLINEL